MKVRVLSVVTLAGQNYDPNTVLDIDKATSKDLIAAGLVDDAAAAVDYCISVLGVTAITPGADVSAQTPPAA